MQGSTLDEKQTARRAARQARRARRARLSRGRGDITRRLSWIDLRAELRQWLLIPAVFCLTALLLILPMNLLTTFSSPRFVTYVGAPLADVRADLRFFDEVGAVREDMVAAMEADPELVSQVRFKTLVTVAAGTVLGTVIAATLGEAAVGSLIAASGFGPASLRFITQPWVVHLGYPLILVAVGFLAAVAVTAGLRRGETSEWLTS